MLRSVNSMIGYSILARDGELGKVGEFVFENKVWTIRYFVVEAGGWLSSRKVLISPIALGKLDWQLQTFLVNLTIEQIRNSPEIDTEKPVSRQLEADLFKHYQWPVYWGNGFLMGSMSGMDSNSLDIHERIESKENSIAQQNEDNLHLHGTHTVMSIHAVDGEIGHVEDYIVNSESWAITFLVVNTANWLPGKKVLISPQLINHLDLANKAIFVNLMKEVVENSQEFDPTQLVNTVHEDHLYDYYGRPRVDPVARQKLFGF